MSSAAHLHRLNFYQDSRAHVLDDGPFWLRTGEHSKRSGMDRAMCVIGGEAAAYMQDELLSLFHLKIDDIS